MKGLTEIDINDKAQLDALEGRLIKASVASCTCGTKTPDNRFHAEDCHWRAIIEAYDVIVLMRERHG